MDELVRWLGEQLDDDERIAREATEDVGIPEWIGSDQSGHAWRYNYGGVWGVTDGLASDAPEVVLTDFAGIQSHIAAHDPARVLREIDAKRRVLARHHAAPVPPGSEWATEFPYCAAHAYPGHDGSTVYPVELKDCPDLRDLASIYADRPGYREEWRP